MAYVPDTAIERMDEVSDSAFKMFVYFCKRRNKDTGVCFPSLKSTAADCGLNYSYASVIRKELVVKKWVEIIEERFINCLVGFGISKLPLEFPNNLSGIEFGISKLPLEYPKPSLEYPKPSLDIPNSIYKEVLNQDNKPRQLTKTQREPKQRAADTVTKLPVGFSISEDMRSWASNKTPNVSIDDELEEFATFWQDIAVKNHRRTAKGWVGTWQNRMRAIEKLFIEKNGGKTNGTNKSNGSQYPRKRTDEDVFRESSDFYANYPN